VIREGRARYVIPHYPHPDWDLPGTRDEEKFLKKRFAAKPVPPEAAAVRDLLGKPGSFDLLHFAGHGFAESKDIANAQIMMEGRLDGQGNYLPAYLSATTVEQFADLSLPEGLRPIVVLNACQAGRAGYRLTSIGGFAQAFLKGRAGAFVGALWSVGDAPARTFTETFYGTLLKAKPKRPTVAESANRRPRGRAEGGGGHVARLRGLRPPARQVRMSEGGPIRPPPTVLRISDQAQRPVAAPERTCSPCRRLNSAGYGGWDLGIVDSSSPERELVSTERGNFTATAGIRAAV